ncbi:MAG: hypothetical protein U1F34_09515 [Gammaproteobacteria bacterium]
MSLPLTWSLLLVAALLEVGGDAIVRKGLNDRLLAVVMAGCVVLGLYGVVVNTVKWDFSKLLGVYVVVFAVVSVLVGKYVFRDSVPLTTWAGLALIVAGGLVIQFGSQS